MTEDQKAAPQSLDQEDVVQVEYVGLSTEEQGHKLTLKQNAEAKGEVEMFVGGSEFASIAKELGLIQPPRPLTHDIYLGILKGLEVSFERLEIYDLKDNAFLARLHLVKKNKPQVMEIRPSDGIALALHMRLPIFLNRRLLKGILSDTDQQTLAGLVKTVKF